MSFTLVRWFVRLLVVVVSWHTHTTSGLLPNLHSSDATIATIAYDRASSKESIVKSIKPFCIVWSLFVVFCGRLLAFCWPLVGLLLILADSQTSQICIFSFFDATSAIRKGEEGNARFSIFFLNSSFQVESNRSNYTQCVIPHCIRIWKSVV